MLINKKTLHEEVVSRLRDMITKGELRERDKINENTLCKAMGISKTPLREALRVLSAMGLVDLTPNRGAYVSKTTFEEIKEMFDVMSVLEGLCARAAAENMKDEDFSSLENLHRRLEEKYEMRNAEDYLHENHKYHSLLQDLSRNKTLSHIISGLRQRILLYRFQSLGSPERFDQSIKEHRQLLEAFRERQPEKAEQLMRQHLKNQCEAIKRLRESGSPIN